MESRVCSKCGNEYPLTSEFFPVRESNRFRNTCKQCEAQRLKTYYEKNKDRLLEYSYEYRIKNNSDVKNSKKKYYDSHKEQEIARASQYYQDNKEDVLKKQLAYREANRDKINAHSKLYRDTHKEKIKEKDRLYRINNSDKIKAKEKAKRTTPEYKAMHKARNQKYLSTENGRLARQVSRQSHVSRKANVEASYTKEDWIRCKEYFDNCCAYCGRHMDRLTQDHFIPLSKGGGYVKDNIVPACKSCNDSKGTKDFNEWYSNQPYFSDERVEKILSYLKYN
jgi:hypothetical protein